MARKLGQKAGYFVALANCIAYFIALLVIALVFWVGGVRYLNGQLTDPGALIQVGIFILRYISEYAYTVKQEY